MDPNETLKRAREASRTLRCGVERAEDFYSITDLAQAAAALSEHFDALDAWLVRGGFLPADWEGKP
jgi:hypothetical protein